MAPLPPSFAIFTLSQCHGTGMIRILANSYHHLSSLLIFPAQCTQIEAHAQLRGIQNRARSTSKQLHRIQNAKIRYVFVSVFFILTEICIGRAALERKWTARPGFLAGELAQESELEMISSTRGL